MCPYFFLLFLGRRSYNTSTQYPRLIIQPHPTTGERQGEQSKMAALPKRIVKETERLMAEPYASSARPSTLRDPNEIFRVPGISAVPHEDNLRYFDVLIHGPSQSPYECQNLCPRSPLPDADNTISRYIQTRAFPP